MSLGWFDTFKQALVRVNRRWFASESAGSKPLKLAAGRGARGQAVESLFDSVLLAPPAQRLQICRRGQAPFETGMTWSTSRSK